MRLFNRANPTIPTPTTAAWDPEAVRARHDYERLREIEQNLATIRAVPTIYLPGAGAVRGNLLLLASSGLDVYCYRHDGDRGAWRVWLESVSVPLADYLQMCGEADIAAAAILRATEAEALA